MSKFRAGVPSDLPTIAARLFEHLSCWLLQLYPWLISKEATFVPQLLNYSMCSSRVDIPSDLPNTSQTPKPLGQKTLLHGQWST